MAHTKASLQGQSKETLQDILWTWKMIQSTSVGDMPYDAFTKDEADEMVRLITNELNLKK